MTLNFYIDPEHFPYQHQGDLSFSNTQLVTELGSANTWLLWTLRTYLELKDHFTCLLIDKMPENGIIFFFRGSVNMTQKPVKGQFWICMVADSTWHPYSHVNLFQNNRGIKKYPQSWFIRHWQQLGIKKSESVNVIPKNIYYIGDVPNLAAELQSEDWAGFLRDNNFNFVLPDFSRWGDFSDVDVVLGIRSFNPDAEYDNKPSSKLINAWRAGVIFIGGKDSAYAYERQSDLDFISVDTYAALKAALVELKSNRMLFQSYRRQAAICANRFPDTFFKRQWIDLLKAEILPLYQKTAEMSSFERGLFIARRFLTYRLEALALRFKH